MGKIIQNYSLQELIGEGVYGKVWKGFHVVTRQPVAIKVIKSQKFKEIPKLQQCTVNQINTLSNICNSPHIVRYLDMLKTVNNYYFVYEYCNGGTLRSILQQHKGQLPLPLSLNYFRQLLQAFKILTQLHIMHRDLKPDNILLHNNLIKVADFGFCKNLQKPTDIAQTMLGSPIYMAPEVLKGEKYTIKADIWSLGVVLYEMLYGVCPFESSSIAKLIQVLDKEELRFPRQTTGNVEMLLGRMLTKEPGERMEWAELFQVRVGEADVSGVAVGRGRGQGSYKENNKENESGKRMPLTVSNFERKPSRMHKPSLKSPRSSNTTTSLRKSQSFGHTKNSASELKRQVSTCKSRKSDLQSFVSSPTTVKPSKHSKHYSSSLFRSSKPIILDTLRKHQNICIIIKMCLELVSTENCRETVLVVYVIVLRLKREYAELRQTMERCFEEGQGSWGNRMVQEEVDRLGKIEEFVRVELGRMGMGEREVEEGKSLELKASLLRSMAVKSRGLSEQNPASSILFLQLADYFQQFGCLRPQTYGCLTKQQLSSTISQRLSKMR